MIERGFEMTAEKLDKGYYWIKFKDYKEPIIGYYDAKISNYPWQIIGSDEIYEEKHIMPLRKIKAEAE